MVCKNFKQKKSKFIICWFGLNNFKIMRNILGKSLRIIKFQNSEKYF